MKKKVWKKALLWSFLSVLTITAVFVIGILIYSTTVKLDKTKLSISDTAIEIYDCSDALVSASIGKADIDRIPENLKNAFISTEDKRFYRHHGLDYYRIAGALVHDIKTKSFEQGASTISCQLIKNTHLSNEKSIKRKVDEAILSIKLEKNYSKEQILETYLNVIYFGNGIYGIANASYSYFDKSPDQLTLGECASLSAIVANPSKYSPVYHPAENNERKNTVLKLMLDQKYISQEEYNQAVSETVKANNTKYDQSYGYNQIAISEASDLLGISEAELKRSGYKIYTYLDRQKQIDCSDSIRKCDVSASIIIGDNREYSIIGYSSNHRFSPFTMQRNAGSIIKPFIYASAFENRVLYPITRIDDLPSTFGDYTPRNYSDIYKGKISIREALAYSSNVCAVKVLQSVGLDRAKNTLGKFGFELTESDNNYTLALGVTNKGVSIEKVLSAYGSLANQGIYKKFSTIRYIEAKDGKIVYMRDASDKRIIDEKTADMINDCLNYCTQKGTARKLAEHKNLCSKTGTFEVGDKNSDSWFVGYDAENTYCVWLGNLSMKKEDMISKKGSSGIDYVADIIDRDNVYPKTTNQKQAIDVLTLERQNRIELASFNTPQRYIVFDYAPDNAPISQTFISPKADCVITLENDLFKIVLSPQSECKYNVYHRTELMQNLIATVDNSIDIVRIEFSPFFGKNSILIVPIAKGIYEIEGERYQEDFYY